MTRSFAVEMQADASGKWAGNNVRFATYDEARRYARDLRARWTLVTETRVVEFDQPANYRWHPLLGLLDSEVAP